MEATMRKNEPADIRRNIARQFAPKSHFGQRCLDRGIESVDGDALAKSIQRAVLAEDDSVVQRVMPSKSGGTIYRFWVAEGIFYAVCLDNGWPATLLTQEMVRGKKWSRRMAKRGGRRANMKVRA